MTTTTQPTISDGLNFGAMADEILAARRRRLTAAHVASRLGDGCLVGGDPLFNLLDSLDESRVLLEKAVVALLEQVEVLGRVVAHGSPRSSVTPTLPGSVGGEPAAATASAPEGSDVEGSASADSSTSRGCHCGADSLTLVEIAIFAHADGGMAHTAAECFAISELSYARKWSS